MTERRSWSRIRSYLWRTVARLGRRVPTLVCITLITFALIHWVPGDPLAASQADTGGRGMTPEAMAQLERLLHLDRPLFLNWDIQDRARKVEALVRALPDAAARAALVHMGTAAVPGLIAAGQGALAAEMQAHAGLDAEGLARCQRPEPSASVEQLASCGTLGVPALAARLLAAKSAPVEREQAASALRGLLGVSLPYDVAASPFVHESELAAWREEWADLELDYRDLSRADRLFGALTCTQYAEWLRRAVTLDFGLSLVDGRPVAERLRQAAPATLLLFSLSLLLAYGAAIPLAVWSARREGRPSAQLVSGGLFLLYSVPSFWAAEMAIVLLCGVSLWNLFPLEGLRSPRGGLGDLAWHLTLPVSILAYPTLAVVTRLGARSVHRALGEEFAQTARAKGLSEPQVAYRHALRASLLPLLTVLGLEIPTLASFSVVVERAFGIHGLGLLTLDAIAARDYPTLMAVLTVMTLAAMVGLALTDIAAAAADPRLSEEALEAWR